MAGMNFKTRSSLNLPYISEDYHTMIQMKRRIFCNYLIKKEGAAGKWKITIIDSHESLRFIPYIVCKFHFLTAFSVTLRGNHKHYSER